jgi:class 3 adenylate cyclase/tetratricopeptide (TPR) repeat protein
VSSSALTTDSLLATGRDHTMPARRTSGDADTRARLVPYVPRAVLNWLADTPETRHRQIAGTGVYADISGFTALTERLAERGKLGAEETGDLLNQVFEPLLAAAYEYGANLVKWAGDGVLLFFDGDDDAQRAARAAWAMQAKLRSAGSLRVGSHAVRLGMSVGMHTGDFDFLLVGSRHRELIVTGPAATATAALEKAAVSGMVLVSQSTAARLDERCLGPGVDVAVGGRTLVAPPKVATTGPPIDHGHDVDLACALSPALREHLLAGGSDHEHRVATIAFIEFTGVDELVRTQGYEAMVAAVSYILDLVQQTAHDTEVSLLSTDVNEDGGKILLVAGAPRSLGDDEARLLSAVRRVVRPGGRLTLRAGVTRGRVFAGDYGPPYRRTYSVIGDSVNLAARVMAAAHPGQILATPDVVSRSRTAFVTTPVPPFPVKGKREPVSTLDVGDVVHRSARPPLGGGALVGRGREIDFLHSALAEAKDGRGQVVDLVGPAGIGKSSLVAALASQANCRVLWTDGDPYERVTPYQPMHGLLRRTLGFQESADIDSIADILVELASGTAPHLLPWMSLIGIVAGVAMPASRDVTMLDPTARKTRLEAVTSELMGRALSMPTLLVINDAHDMDSATLDLVSRLCQDVADRPWLIVVTRRSDAPELVPADHVTRLDLEPLDSESAAQLLVKATGSAALTEQVLQQLTWRGGGNPLFLEALAASVAAGDDVDELPDSIEGVLAARIDRLPPGQRRWLRSASVLGDSVNLELLNTVVGPEDAGVDWRDELAEFIVDDGAGRLQFVHGLVRLAAYEGLPFRQRTDLHARVALAIESESQGRPDEVATMLSLHYLLGELFDPAWHYACHAGLLARESSALSQAAECYRRALVAARHLPELPPTEVAETWEALAAVHLDLGELFEAEQALRQARSRLRDDPVKLARVRLHTAHHREAAGLYPEALTWVTRALHLLGGRTDLESRRLRAELADRYAQIRYRQGQISSAVRWAESAAAEATACGDELVAARAREILALAAASTGRDWDEHSFHASIALYEQHGDLSAKARAHNRLGAALYHVALWDGAAEQFSEAEATYRTLGREADAITNAVNRAEMRIDQGRHAEALAILNTAMPAWFATESLSYLALGHLLLGRIDVARGLTTQARANFEQSRVLRERLGETAEDRTLETWLAECARAAGDLEEARARADEALDAIGATDTPLLAQLHRVRGLTLIAQGEHQVGRDALADSLDAARRWRSYSRVVDALAALLDTADGSEPPEQLAEWYDERDELAGRLGLARD